MFVHVDVSFDFLNTLRDYIEASGDVAFAAQHWTAIRAAYGYCRSTCRLALEIENSGPPLTLAFRPDLPTGVHVRSASTSAGARLMDSTNAPAADEIHVVCPVGRTRLDLRLAASR
jgi:hypothetical protein